MALKVRRMTDLALRGKRVLIREDLNVPVKNGKITSTARLDAALPTLRAALDAGARVLVMSHLGRPKEGKPDPAASLKPVADRLGEMLGRKVPLVENWLDGVALEDGEIALCENVRFNVGEEADDDALAKRMAALCDVFVMDAFGTAHRAQASTNGVARFAPVACAGPLLVAELEALAAALQSPKRPLVAILGGSKVSTKLEVLKELGSRVDAMIVGGGIANTFILAAHGRIGKSLAEPDLVPEAQAILNAFPGKVPVPVDAVCAKEFSAHATPTLKAIEDVADDDLILDIGPTSIAAIKTIIAKAGTIVWNGPVGVFEFDAFAEGTRAIAEAVAESPAFSIAGGGDTIAAINKFGVGDRVSYISTAGGAFLEFLEGKKLPAVAILESRA